MKSAAPSENYSNENASRCSEYALVQSKTLVPPMQPLRRAWRYRCLSRLAKRELSLAYNLHEPHEPEPGHAPLIVLHGLFGSKQNNRSISKYGFSRPAFKVRYLIEAGHLHETSKRQCMRLSVLDMVVRETLFANHSLGFKESWRLATRSSARLFSDGR